MPRITTPLSDKEVKAAKAKEKLYKLFDGGGLFMEIHPKQQKRWRIKYRFKGKDKTLSLGTYPNISLKAARIKREEIKRLVSEGIDPSQQRKDNKALELKKQEEEINTFKRSAKLYIEHLRPIRNEKYWNSIESAFDRDINPIIGNKNINDINAKDIIEVLLHIQSRGAIETAHRLFSQISSVFKYAVSNTYADRNPCNDMDKNHVLKQVQSKHYATITDSEQIGKLLYDINKYSGAYTVRMALRFAPYIALRPYNIRHARWENIDFISKLWTIPAQDMKTGKEHIVPLTDSMLKILNELKSFSGDREYVFPSDKKPKQPLSDTTLNKALRRMGYSGDKFVAHGFRAMFSTITNEQSGFRFEVIETQLAHKIGNSVSRAYNRALYMDERKDLMQWWSDYLDRQTENYVQYIQVKK